MLISIFASDGTGMYTLACWAVASVSLPVEYLIGLKSIGILHIAGGCSGTSNGALIHSAMLTSQTSCSYFEPLHVVLRKAWVVCEWGYCTGRSPCAFGWKYRLVFCKKPLYFGFGVIRNLRGVVYVYALLSNAMLARASISLIFYFMLNIWTTYCKARCV